MGQISRQTSLEPLTLSLETATRAGSLALIRGNVLVASSKGVAEESHSVNLLSQIEAMLAGAQVALRDIELFATAAGPGWIGPNEAFVSKHPATAPLPRYIQTPVRWCPYAARRRVCVRRQRAYLRASPCGAR